jgi:hypothetical protein
MDRLWIQKLQQAIMERNDRLRVENVQYKSLIKKKKSTPVKIKKRLELKKEPVKQPLDVI